MKTNPEIKILVIDDRMDNLLSYRAILEDKGYVIYEANSGKEALKILLNETDFTLILMDVHMPGLNGFETAELIYEREILKHIPIIFVTAEYNADEFIFEGYKAGAVDYITKPIKPEILKAKVAVFADLYRKNHMLIEQDKLLREINLSLEEKVRRRTEEIIAQNEELLTTNDQLRRVNSELDSFVYAASHDLKSPVSNIEGLLFLLEQNVEESCDRPREIIKILDMMKSSIVRFKSTVEDLSVISHLNREVELEQVNIDEVLNDVLEEFDGTIKSLNADISSRMEPSLQICISRNNLRSILTNLIGNSLKYRSPERDPEISIKCHKEEQYTVIIVEDNGIGFNPQDKQKIFGMFKRMHTHVEGSGVGLYLVKKILTNYGGFIEADSIPGVGSRFTVYCPNKSVCNRKVGKDNDMMCEA
jgi:two-component system, sensor histidine kinase and response regulator